MWYRFVWLFFSSHENTLVNSRVIWIAKTNTTEEKMAKELGVTLITGPRGCSKSTVAKLAYELANTPTVIFENSSTIISEHIQSGTRIGRQLSEFSEAKEKGFIMPGDLVYEAIYEWLWQKCSERLILQAIIAGCTRSVEEAQRWKKFNGNVRAIHIDANESQVMAGVIARQLETGVVRSDENSEAVANAMREHREKILPSVQLFNGNTAYTSRSEPMRSRLTTVVKHMPIPEQVRERMLGRLNTKDHPVSLKVDKLDGIHLKVLERKVPAIRPWLFANANQFPHFVGLRQNSSF